MGEAGCELVVERVRGSDEDKDTDRDLGVTLRSGGFSYGLEGISARKMGVKSLRTGPESLL